MKIQKKYLRLNQVKFKSDLNKLKRRQYKPEKQISAIQNIKDFLFTKKIIKSFKDYSLMIFEAKYEAKLEKDSKH